MKPILHKDGSVTFMHNGITYFRRSSVNLVELEELGGEEPTYARRIALHLASRGSDAAQQYLDDLREEER